MQTTKLTYRKVEKNKNNLLLTLYNRNIMKRFKLFLTAVIAVSLAAFCSSCSKDSGSDSNGSKQELEGYIKAGVNEFHTAINNDSDPQIVDYRSAEDFAKGHIKGAVNIDGTNPADWSTDNGVFMQKLTSQFSTSKKIFLYGKSGWSQTGLALPGRVARIWGSKNTVNLEGGYSSWEKNFPNEVEK